MYKYNNYFSKEYTNLDVIDKTDHFYIENTHYLILVISVVSKFEMLVVLARNWSPKYLNVLQITVEQIMP